MAPRIVFFIITLGFWVFMTMGSALAQQVEITIDGDPPWRVSADKIESFGAKEIYQAEGSVKLTRDRETIQADKVRFHAATRSAEISGYVRVTTREFQLVCSRMVMNLDRNVGKIYQGTAFFPNNHYYISGDEIERTGPDTFLVVKGRATSCDGPNPAWTLSGHNLMVQREGYATAEDVTFATSFMPMFYLPWLKVPVKTQRQSGFLMPYFSNSTLMGVIYTQPYFWAMTDSRDLTFYMTFMGLRGFQPAVEYRYDDWIGKGMYQAEYLRDWDAPTIEYDNYRGPTKVRDRYWVRGMSDLELEQGYEVKLDVDLVSDPEYIEDFKRSYTGHLASQGEYLKEFGRVQNEPLDPMRKTVLQGTKSQNNQSLRAAIEYTDNLKSPYNLETIQRLPQIDYTISGQEITRTPFYFDNEAQYTYFSRQTNRETVENSQGHRLDVHPTVYWPVNFSRFLDLEPSVGLRGTAYYPHGLDQDAGERDRNNQINSRAVYDAQIQASSTLARVYDLPWESVPRMKHRIKPVLTFSYVPKVKQEKLPFWDSVDRINEEEKVTYGLASTFSAKFKRNQAGPRQAGRAGEVDDDREYYYREFLRLSLFRSYNYVEERRDLEKRDPFVLQDYNRPHSPWQGRVEFDLSPYFWAQASSKFDSYVGYFVDHTVEALTQDHRGDYVYLEYGIHLEPHNWKLEDRREAEYRELHTILNLELVNDWAFQLDWRHSINGQKNIETLYSLNYSPQCWGLRLEYYDSPKERSFAVFVSLLNLGEVGGLSHRVEPPESLKGVLKKD
ncbi:MAG: LPS assembly protein LptD [Pseudomonadota bacterium]